MLKTAKLIKKKGKKKKEYVPKEKRVKAKQKIKKKTPVKTKLPSAEEPITEEKQKKKIKASAPEKIKVKKPKPEKEAEVEEIPLTNLSGLGPATAKKFIEVGVKSVEQLCEEVPEELAHLIPGCSEDRISKWVEEGKKLLDK